ncbi:MAG TPA: (d)CMP kinase [Candidatus Babeliales bacterium]|jgi:cytidylate kinase|nr:(d)CMP kinase [Candidatus Babeliales bacterium]
MIITIDGPVASGKSTVSRILADKLGCYYLCSGLIYRAIAYLLVNNYGYTITTIDHIAAEDVKQCADVARLRYHYDELCQERIFFDNRDITLYLKDKFMDQVSSIVSVNRDVREAVTAIQRDIASHYNIVTDGRDVGSVVFPAAQVKFFLTASVEVRASRWRKDQEKYDNHFSLAEAVALITERDNRDKNRTIAPLIIPSDAIVIDNSELNVEQVVEKMMYYINDRLSSELL